MEAPTMVTIDILAQMVARGFNDQQKQIDDLRNSMTNHFEGIETKINGINNRLDDLALNRTTRDEHYLLTKRVDRIESKIGLKTEKS